MTSQPDLELVSAALGSAPRSVQQPLPDWSPPGSTLREDMRGDLVHALRWAAERLGLPLP